MVPTKRHSSATPKSSSLSGKKKVSTVQEYGQALVGSRIRVWWPLDLKFYEGVVESYLSSLRKHRVLYDDGDVEILNLNKQRWESIDDDEETVAEEISVEEADTDESSADGTPEPKKKRAGKGKLVATMPKKTDSSSKSKLGNVGGKVLAAASRMSVRCQRKDNGQPKALSARKNTAASGNPKRKRGSSPPEAASEKLKKPRASSRKVKDSNPDDEETSDEDDAKPLVSFMNKLKGGMEKEGGESSSRNGKEEESSGSEAGEEDSEKEAGEDSSDESGEGEGREESEGEEGSDGGEGSQGSEGEGEEEGESSGNETDES
ncbi:putative sister chromatid cohesion protein PDS5 [Cardamine amara subsp. amara]|uniref:Sister chromatid cohesion protein PDS5 n=1 Tax=Cardamine amara subsp. amara TaxID=228776 RepID=A0ABD0ZK11_CARAN